MPEQSRLSAVLAESRRQFPALFALSGLTNILLLATSIYMLQVFDRVLSSGSIDTLIWLTVITVVAIVTYGLLEHFRRVILRRTGAWIESELAPDVLKQSVNARLTHGRSPAGLGDVADIRAFVSGDGLAVILDAPWMPVFLAIIWLMHPVLGIIATAGALVLFLVAVVNDVLTRRTLAMARKSRRDVREDAEQFVENAETLSGLGMIGSVINRWRRNFDQSETDSGGASEASIGFYNLARTVRLGLQVAILGAGAWLVVRGELTSGGMIAASVILSRALSPVERAIGAWRSFGSYKAARRRLGQLYLQSPPNAERISLPRPKGHLEVKDVRFFSPETKSAVLKSVGFELKAGEMCGILGPSGSGKTSLCKILVGAWRSSIGTVRLDVADVAEWDSEELGRYVGYLPQNIELFRGTVAENIGRMTQIDDAKVLEAAEISGAHDMILKLPEGYETDVGKYADRLSGGQRQRVGLARALYGNPSLVVLDEPNSNLDGTGEIALQRALKHLRDSGSTVIIVGSVYETYAFKVCSF